VDLGVCERLAALLPASCVAVAESGLRQPRDIARLRAMGYQAFLIGEWLSGSPDPEGLLRAIVLPEALAVPESGGLT
jgi:indole-3-glycerol phosphate synthase